MEKRTHILIVPSEDYLPNDGLNGVFQQHQADALAKVGYRVGIISPILRSLRSFGGDWRRWGTTRTREKNIQVHRHFGWYRPHSDAAERRRQWISSGLALYRDYVRRNGQPNLLHAHNASWAGMLGDAVHRRANVPYVLTEHNTAYGRGLVSLDSIADIQQVFQSAAATIMVSPSLGHDVERVVGAAAAGWEWVPNVLPRIFEDTPILDEHSRPSIPFRFLNVGTLDDKKGHADLLRAFATAFANRSDALLTIVGDGPLRGGLIELANELGIRDRVTFTGVLQPAGVLAEMHACDAFVLSSRIETFGVVVIEAMASGKPVIATKCGGPEWFVEAQDGLLVPPSNPSMLGVAMEKLIIGIRGYNRSQIRQRCIERFGSAALAKALTPIYDRVLNISSIQ